MYDFSEEIVLLKQNKADLFYNSSGLKEAYLLGVKHIGSAEFLGFADALTNGDLRIKKTIFLVDFENKKITEIKKDSVLTPIKLETY